MWLIQTEFILPSLAWSNWKYYYCPLDGIPVQCMVSQAFHYASPTIHWYPSILLSEERHSKSQVSCPRTQHNDLAWSQPWPLNPDLSALTSQPWPLSPESCAPWVRPPCLPLNLKFKSITSCLILTTCSSVCSKVRTASDLKTAPTDKPMVSCKE